MTQHRNPDDGFDREPEDDDMFARRERARDRQRQRGVSDFVRRAFENTVGSVQGSGNLPKDAITYLLQQGDRGKREVVRIVAKEVGDFLRQVDISSEVVKILSSLQVEVSATVRFKPTEDGKAVRPEVEAGSQLAVLDGQGRDLLQPDPDEDDEPLEDEELGAPPRRE
jgi:hypothetical protein